MGTVQVVRLRRSVPSFGDGIAMTDTRRVTMTAVILMVKVSNAGYDCCGPVFDSTRLLVLAIVTADLRPEIQRSDEYVTYLYLMRRSSSTGTHNVGDSMYTFSRFHA